MKQNQESIMEYVLGLFFHVNHGLEINDVKKYLSNTNALHRNQEFKKEIAEAIINEALSPQQFEKLTGEEFETQKELSQFLINDIWKPLYGDEPIKA